MRLAIGRRSRRLRRRRGGSKEIAEQEGEAIARHIELHQTWWRVGMKSELKMFAAAARRFLAFAELGLDLPVLGAQFAHGRPMMGADDEAELQRLRELAMPDERRHRDPDANGRPMNKPGANRERRMNPNPLIIWSIWNGGCATQRCNHRFSVIRKFEQGRAWARPLKYRQEQNAA